MIMLDSLERVQRLDATDRRARHIVDVLLREGSRALCVGCADGGGRMGKALTSLLPDRAVEITVRWEDDPFEAVWPLHFLVGLPRPQTARRILRDAPTLGMRSLRFFQSGKGERGYAGSSLWSSDEWRHLLVEGAEQAFHPWMPEVKVGGELDEVLKEVPEGVGKLALDLYEAEFSLVDALHRGGGDEALGSLWIAIGPERGWSAMERDCLRKHGFVLCELGKRVLRTDTALVVATATWRAVSERLRINVDH